MPASAATLPQLVHQLRDKFDGANVARCCLLIGAGCSYNSKIPLGGGLVELLKMESFRQYHVVESTNWPLDKADDYKKQFDTHLDKNNLRDTYERFSEKGELEIQQQIDNLSADIRRSRLPLQVQEQSQEEQDAFFHDKKNQFYQDAQYEYWFRRYSENANERQRFVERVIDGKDTGYGYVTLASLIAEGYVRNVFTTNFDDLLHDALMLFFNERVKVYAHSDLSDFLNLRDKKPNIIKLHGDFRYQDIRNTTVEIDETRNRLAEKLSDALAETPCFNLVVMGYGGADVSILNQLLEAKLRNPHSPFRLIWTDRKPLEELHWRVRHLLETTFNNFFLQVESFDLLMLQLHQALQLKPVQIEEKAKERQQQIDSYYGQMQTQVADANLSTEEKVGLQDFLRANALFEKAYESKDLVEACQLYEQVLQLQPGYSDAFYNWGITLDELGRHEEAITKYEQALQIKPNDPDALYNWGNALDMLGRYEEAITKYEQVLQIKPNSPSALTNWGNVLYEFGRHEEAITKYEQALKIKPNHLYALHNWGSVLFELGRYEEASTKYEWALQIKLNDPDALCSWGTALAKIGHYEEAIAKYEQALPFNPNNSKVLYNWGTALAKLGRHEEAITKYEQASQIKPNDPDALNNWGVALSNLGHYRDAIAKYEQALQINPNDSAVFFNMACAYAMQMNIEETIHYLIRWREADKNATIEKIDNDSDFDLIREDPIFQQYLASWPVAVQ